MSLKLACMKGCGESIMVTDEQIAEFTAMNAAIEVSHDVCPRDAVEKNTYSVTVLVYRLGGEPSGNDTLLAKAGGTIDAASFVSGIPAISAQLQKSWERVVEMAPIAETA